MSPSHCSLLSVLGLGVSMVATAPVARAAALDSPGAGPIVPQVLVMLRMAPQHFRPDAGYGGSYGDGEGRGARDRIAHRLAEQLGVSVMQEWPMPTLSVDCYVMSVPLGHSSQELAAQFSRKPEVSWSEPVHVYRAQAAALATPMPEPATHDDPLYRVQPAAKEWHLAELHRSSTGRGVRIAVIDSMIDAEHPDLSGQVDTAQNFVSSHPSGPEEHGTAVAGIIAAKADNRLGIAGIAPHAEIMGLRACWQATSSPPGTFCDSLNLGRALDYAITHDAQIINMSLSGPGDRLLSKLLDVALAQNVVVVAAADPGVPDGGFPADHPGVVAVAAEAGSPAPAGALYAPGRDVPTTIPGARWGMENGSSFATAHVSGLYALLRQETPRVRGAGAIMTADGGGIDAARTLARWSSLNGCRRDSRCAVLANASASRQKPAAP